MNLSIYSTQNANQIPSTPFIYIFYPLNFLQRAKKQNELNLSHDNDEHKFSCPFGVNLGFLDLANKGISEEN